MDEKIARIGQLNDQLRVKFIGGQIMFTAAVAALDPKLKAKILQAVREFNDFTPDNDPHREHDMCFVEVDGEKYFAKINCYAPDMQHGSEDPSDPEKTRRVLTIGHASDY